MDVPESVAGFDKMLGLEILEASGDRVVLQCDVTADLLQPYGIVHGGVHCSLVETAASIGAALWFGNRGNVVGVANSTNFLRAARKGRLTAVAEPIHRGRTQQLWRVTITDEADRHLALGELRTANVPDADVLGAS